MSTAYSISGALSLPPDAGQPVASIVFSGAATFTSKVDLDLVLTGSGTHVVNMGSIASPGAKLVLLEVDDGASAAVNVRVNGGSSTGQTEICSGGFLVLSSPSPTTGITAISIVFTADVTVHVHLLS